MLIITEDESGVASIERVVTEPDYRCKEFKALTQAARNGSEEEKIAASLAYQQSLEARGRVKRERGGEQCTLWSLNFITAQKFAFRLNAIQETMTMLLRWHTIESICWGTTRVMFAGYDSFDECSKERW